MSDFVVNKDGMTIYKFSFRFIFFIFIIVYGLITIQFIFDKPIVSYYIDLIFLILGWFVFLISIPTLLSFKVYLNSEEIFIQLKKFYKKTRKNLTWKEISKIEYRNEILILSNNMGTKLTFLKYGWQDYDHLFLQIYQNVTENNPNCIIDHSFIDYLKLIYKGKNVMINSNIEIQESQNNNHVEIYKVYRQRLIVSLYKMFLYLVLMFFWTILLASFSDFYYIYNILLIIYVVLWSFLLFFLISLSHDKVFLSTNSIYVQSLQFFNKKRLWKDLVKIEYKRKKVVLINSNGRRLKLNQKWKNHKDMFLNIYQIIIEKNTNCEIDRAIVDYLNDIKRKNPLL